MFMIPTQPVVLGGFPAYAVLDPLKTVLVAKIKDIVNALSPHGRFPGPNPCSLERADLVADMTGNWLCEKTDGTRALLAFVTHEGIKLVLLVTRAWDVYVVTVKKCPKVLFQGTVFDGELVFRDAWTWLGFDAVIVSGVPIFKEKLSERLEAARRSLKAYAPHPGDSLQLEFKKFFREFGDYKKYLGSTTHPIDGTIVTPENAPVVIGRHTSLFKLKSGNKHTVDFEFSAPGTLSVYDPKRHALVAVGNLVACHAGSDDVVPDGSVVEAAWKSGTDWILVTLRTDKTTSNDLLTYTKTMINIQENLGLGDLEACWK